MTICKLTTLQVATTRSLSTRNRRRLGMTDSEMKTAIL